MKIFAIFLLLSLFLQADELDQIQKRNEENNNQQRLKLFIQVTFTRSWEFQRWRLLNGNEKPEIKMHLKQSMVAYAFNYWLLVKKKMIDPVLPFEKMIQNSFRNDELPIELASNPLVPPLGINGPQLTDEEYKEFAREFSDFVLNR